MTSAGGGPSGRPVVSLAAPGSKPAFCSLSYRSLDEFQDPKTIQALLNMSPLRSAPRPTPSAHPSRALCCLCQRTGVRSRDLGHFPQPAIYPSSRQPRKAAVITVVTSLLKPDGTFKSAPSMHPVLTDRRVPRPPSLSERDNHRQEAYALATQRHRMQQHVEAHQANVHALYQAEGLAERLGHLCSPSQSPRCTSTIPSRSW
jgi:hypothetical protein